MSDFIGFVINSPPKVNHQDLVYEPFLFDFGPLNLGLTHRFCMVLSKLLDEKDFKKYKIYHYCSLDYKKQANAAYLEPFKLFA